MLSKLFSPRRIILLFGLIYLLLLVININSIRLFIGDELIYSNSITSLIYGTVNSNNHPLLAKTIIAFSVRFFHSLTGTDLPIYWRITPIFASITSLFFLYRICRLRFSRLLSSTALVLTALDPMFFTFSRLVNLDIFSLMFCLAGLFYGLQFLSTRKLSLSYLSSALIGLSLACKFNLLIFAILQPILFSLWSSPRPTLSKMFKFLFSNYLIIFAAFTLGNFAYFFSQPISSFPHYVLDIVHSHLTLQNDYATQISPITSWFITPQILTLFRVPLSPTQILAVFSFQNPFMFAFNLPVIFLNLFFLIRYRFSDKYTSLIFILLISELLPWLFHLRSTYYYYFLQAIPLVVLLLLELLRHIHRPKYVIFPALIITVLVFALYYPVLIGLSTSPNLESALFTYNKYHYPTVNSIFCQHCSPR
jgi:dolichyl-phosphate-mannose--protein O-mannosyl transferase